MPEPREQPELNNRLTNLECKITELERLVETLNEVVIEQGKLLRRLQSGQVRLTQTMEDLERERIDKTPQKPPHYQ
jgi:uncharacterized coiled-coil protein SlyX